MPTGTASVYHGRPSVERIPFVLLVPHDAWWTAMFNAPPRRTEVYCDVTTPATWVGTTEVTVVDLDLDVRRRRWGVIERLDEDEFAHHGAEFGYDESVVSEIAGRCREVESGARNVDHILTRTLLPEMSGEFLSRMAAGETVSRVRIGVGDGGKFEYEIA